jgi:transcriptional regulator with XRE-family HTH domain
LPAADRPCADPAAEDVGAIVRLNLLRLMRERGLSLQTLADRAGIRPAGLADLLTGRSFPAVEMLWKLGHALDLPCTAFIESPPLSPTSQRAA